MSLSHKQKRYIKKNIQDLSPSKIAHNLGINEAEMVEYLKEKWGNDKYTKYISNKGSTDKIVEKKHLETKKFYTLVDWKGFIKEHWIPLFFLAMVVCVVYANSLFNDFVSDDLRVIVQNKLITTFSNVITNPINFLRNILSFLAFKIGGYAPVYFRIINIFFHLGSTWLVYILLSIIASSPLAFFTAGIFAVHPILIESVAWISGGVYAQYSFFVFLSFLFYILSQNNKKLWRVSVIVYLLSLLSSEKAMTFPFILIVFEFVFYNLLKNWKKIVPYFILSGFWVLGYILRIGQRMGELSTEAINKPGLDNPLVQIPIAITSYLRLIFWPDKLTLYQSEMTFSQEEFLLRWIIFIIFIGLLIFSYKKNKMIFFWVSFFIISLGFSLTPFRVAWTVAERYVYLGSVGIIFVFAYFLNKLRENKRFETLSYIIFIAIVIALSVRTYYRNIDWKNEDNLWIATGKTSPSSPNTHNNLGDVYARWGDLEKSAAEFKKATEINPNYASAYHNLANTYQRMGKTDLALENYQKAASLNPNIWQTYQNLAAIYFIQKNYNLAEENVKKAIKLNPQYIDLYLGLALIDYNKGDKEAAKQAFLEVLKIDPKNEKAKAGLLQLSK